jgi:hypothetical protein
MGIGHSGLKKIPFFQGFLNEDILVTSLIQTIDHGLFKNIKAFAIQIACHLGLNDKRLLDPVARNFQNDKYHSAKLLSKLIMDNSSKDLIEKLTSRQPF